MAHATYIQRGAVLDYVNSTNATIEAGTIVSLTTRCGVAAADIPAGTTGAVMVEGVFELPKATGAITLGAACYYVAADGKVGTTASSNIPCGYCVEAAASGDATVKVKLLG